MNRRREPETLEQALEQFIKVVRADVAERRSHIEAMPSGKESPEENCERVYITAGLMSTLSFLCDLVGKFLPVAEETALGLEVMRLNDLEKLSESTPGVARLTWH